MGKHASSDFAPDLLALADIGLLLETSEVEIALLLLWIMATDAILREERTDFLLESAVFAMSRGGESQLEAQLNSETRRGPGEGSIFAISAGG